MPSLRDFYDRKRILLTGHTGFKGSWLALILAELGAEVHGYALAPDTTPNLFTEAAVESRLASHHIADIRELDTLSKVARDVQPEILFHLAAQPIVLRSYREPRETYEINVMGTVNLLEAARATHSVRVCQVVTSDKCYENREWVYPYREVDPMGGADPYSNSKGCAELVVAAYRKSFFPPAGIAGHSVSLSSARAGNVIGGGDWAEARIIPDCIRALERSEAIAVREPDAVRPWQHVLEPLAGYLQLAAAQWDEPAKFAEPWNFGPLAGSQVPVRSVVDQTIREWGGGSWQHVRPTVNDPKTAGTKKESFLLKLDITKSLTLLGWRPRWDLASTIHHTISWYRQRSQSPGAFDAHRACVTQIREHFGIS